MRRRGGEGRWRRLLPREWGRSGSQTPRCHPSLISFPPSLFCLCRCRQTVVVRLVGIPQELGRRFGSRRTLIVIFLVSGGVKRSIRVE